MSPTCKEDSQGDHQQVCRQLKGFLHTEAGLGTPCHCFTFLTQSHAWRDRKLDFFMDMEARTTDGRGIRRICDHKVERPGTIDRLAQKTAWQALRSN